MTAPGAPARVRTVSQDKEQLLQLYNERILDYAANIPCTDPLADPDATATKDSPLCGSRVSVELKMAEDGTVAEYGQKVRACALGKASASIMGHKIIGQTPDQLRAARDALWGILKEDADAPEGHWQDLQIMAPARDWKSRHGSVMLAYEAVVACLDQIEAHPDD